MATVADMLRQGREARKLDVHQVADLTKIKTEHIRAMEEGRWGAFSAPVYIRGFVRTYAQTLKLPIGQVLVQLDEELSRTPEFSTPPSLIPRKKTVLDHAMLLISTLNWGLVLPLLLGLAVIATAVWGYALWRRHKTTDPLSTLGPGLYQPKSGGGEYLPLPTNYPPAKP
ncbi:MAG: helix-turn-helix domain-containing protein [Verrucomicrobia bacterium]|nr:helix-turn-helix domain-containing protein [Verrucomicrobiota bacterium]